MQNSLCLFWYGPCFTVSEWRDLALIVSTYLALPGVLYAAFKTHVELRKLCEERTRERRARVHEKQLDALTRLFALLKRVQDYSQLTTKPLILEEEKQQNYRRLLSGAVAEAVEEFSRSRLLLPMNVAKMVERFFKKALGSQIRMGIFVRMSEVEGESRAQYWWQTATFEHTEMRTLLASIEAAARGIIHEEDA